MTPQAPHAPQASIPFPAAAQSAHAAATLATKTRQQDLIATNPFGPYFVAFMDHLKATPNGKGRPRSPSTLTATRRAIEGFLICISHYGSLQALPENLLEAVWPQTQGSAQHQSVQLTIRAKAVGEFVRYLQSQGHAVPPIRMPRFRAPTPPKGADTAPLGPPPAPPMPPVPPVAMTPPTPFPAAPVEAPMTPSAPPASLNDFAEPSLQIPGPPNPIPSLPSVQSPPASIVQLAPQPPAPQQQSFGAIPSLPSVQPPARPPMPRPAAPALKVAPSFNSSDTANPLAAYMAQPGYKLRVYLEDDTDDPTCVGDINANVLADVGGPEPLLQKRIIPRAPQLFAGMTSARFSLVPITPDGQQIHSARASFRVAIPPSYQSPAAGQTQLPSAPAPAAVASEVVDAFEPLFERTHERLNAAAQQAAFAAQRVTEAPAAPAVAPEIAELRAQLRDMGSMLQQLAQRVLAPPPAPVAPPPDPNAALMAKLLDVVLVQNRPATPVAPQAPMTLLEQVELLRALKEASAPSNVSVDTSALEKQNETIQRQMELMQAQLTAAQSGGIQKVLGEVKVLRDVADMFRGPQVTPATTFSGALINAFQKVLEDPTPIAEAASTVLSAINGARNGAGGAAPQSTNPRDRLPREVRAAVEGMLGATAEEPLVQATVNFVQQVSVQPGQLGQLGAQLKAALDSDNPMQIVKLLTTSLPRMGYEVAEPRVRAIVATLMARLRKEAAEAAKEADAMTTPAPGAEGEAESEEGEAEAEAEADEDEEGDDSNAAGPEGGAIIHGSPDMHVTVGGATARALALLEAEEAEEAEEADEEAEAEEEAEIATTPIAPSAPEVTAQLSALPEPDEEIGVGEQMHLLAVPPPPAVVKSRNGKKGAR